MAQAVWPTKENSKIGKAWDEDKHGRPLASTDVEELTPPRPAYARFPVVDDRCTTTPENFCAAIVDLKKRFPDAQNRPAIVLSSPLTTGINCVFSFSTAREPGVPSIDALRLQTEGFARHLQRSARLAIRHGRQLVGYLQRETGPDLEAEMQTDLPPDLLAALRLDKLYAAMKPRTVQPPENINFYSAPLISIKAMKAAVASLNSTGDFITVSKNDEGLGKSFKIWPPNADIPAPHVVRLTDLRRGAIKGPSLVIDDNATKAVINILAIVTRGDEDESCLPSAFKIAAAEPVTLHPAVMIERLPTHRSLARLSAHFCDAATPLSVMAKGKVVAKIWPVAAKTPASAQQSWSEIRQSIEDGTLGAALNAANGTIEVVNARDLSWRGIVTGPDFKPGRS